VTPAHVPQVVANHGALPGSIAAVVVDDDGRPVGLLVRGPGGGWMHKRRLLAIAPEDAPELVARRAMSRPPEDRFDPISCCDETGRHMGLVGVDGLMTTLSQLIDGAAA
jgi:hypothetical protein